MNVPLLLCNVFHCNNVLPNKVEKIFTLIMAETSSKGINKISFSIKQMPYRKGFCYSKTKRYCENKVKAGQKGIITKQGKTVNSTHVFNDDFLVCLTKNEVKKPIVELIVLFLFKIYNF